MGGDEHLRKFCDKCGERFYRDHEAPPLTDGQWGRTKYCQLHRTTRGKDLNLDTPSIKKWIKGKNELFMNATEPVISWLYKNRPLAWKVHSAITAAVNADPDLKRKIKPDEAKARIIYHGDKHLEFLFYKRLLYVRWRQEERQETL